MNTAAQNLCDKHSIDQAENVIIDHWYSGGTTLMHGSK